MCRYNLAHIWACPPSEGDDYIFHCHPPEQKIPKPKRLQEWYRKMLDKAIVEGVVHEYKVNISVLKYLSSSQFKFSLRVGRLVYLSKSNAIGLFVSHRMSLKMPWTTICNLLLKCHILKEIFGRM